jgi:hypothetical protein
MSPESDRIAVPTNGRGPHPITDTTPPPASGPAAPGAPTDEELSVAFSPKQLAIGFGIIASLVLLIVGWARRRGPVDD